MCNQKEKNSRPPLLRTQRRVQSSPSPSIWQIWPLLYPPDSCLQAKIKAGSTSDSVYKKVVRWSRCYATGLFCYHRLEYVPEFFRWHWVVYRISTDFINKCIDDIVPTVTIRTYPNQKQWITGNICTELKGRAATFKERDSNPEASIQDLDRIVLYPALTLVGCGRACKLLQTTKGSTAESYPVTQANQTS